MSSCPLPRVPVRPTVPPYPTGCMDMLLRLRAASRDEPRERLPAHGGAGFGRRGRARVRRHLARVAGLLCVDAEQ